MRSGKLMTAWYFSLPENRPVTGEIQAWDIIIDPGHGGYDPGAIREKTNESDLNLSIAYEYTKCTRFCDISARVVLQTRKIHIIHMLNPDGI